MFVYMYKYVNQKGSAVMLAIKRSTDVTPEVNLGNPLCKGKEGYQQENHPSFHHQKSKTALSVAQQKGPMSSKQLYGW